MKQEALTTVTVINGSTNNVSKHKIHEKTNNNTSFTPDTSDNIAKAYDTIYIMIEAIYIIQDQNLKLHHELSI